MGNWVGAVFALVGVLVGGSITLFATKIELQQQTRFERQRIDIQKLEELHMTVSQLEAAYRAIDSWNRYGSGEPPEVQISIDKIKMLAGFYAPQLKPEIARLEELQREFGATQAKIFVFQGMNVSSQEIDRDESRGGIPIT